jgi:crotonobetainyl-CoA:carnitine CoA-transferase CaiB-like acyl-CoA transferase
MIAENARLIWCTVSGFGAESDRPGYDFVVQAESGWMSITGEPLGSPMKVGVALADVIAAKDAAMAIVAALFSRERGMLKTGDRHIVISLIHSATAALVNVAQNTLVSGSDARRWGNAHANLCPYELFDTADRPFVIAVGTDAQWRACMDVLGLGGLGNDPDLATNPGRLANRTRIVTEIARVLRGSPATVWNERFQRAGVPCGVVKSVSDAVREANGSPRTAIPPLPPASIRREPPLLDEHGPLIRLHGWNAFRA